MNDETFASLPPHFHGVVLSPVQWDSILPGYSIFYPSNFRSAIPFLLASLTYHQEWLKANLNASHPLFMSNVWLSGVLPWLLPLVQHGVLVNQVSRMAATGIPPFVPLAYKLKLLQSTVERFQSVVLKKLDDIPKEVYNQVQQIQNTSERHTAPLTLDLLDKTLDEFGSTLLNRLNNTTATNTSTSLSSVGNILESGGVIDTTVGTTTNLLSHDNISGHCGRENPLRRDLDWWGATLYPARIKMKCPKGKVYDLWNLWMDGDHQSNIPPLRTCKTRDFDKRTDQTNFSKAKKVVLKLVSLSNRSEKCIAKMSLPERNDLFQESFLALCRRHLGTDEAGLLSRRRVFEMSYQTVYDLIKR